jgi:hypothetical protein
VDVPCRAAVWHDRSFVGRLERERAVRPVAVVVGGVDPEHVLEVATIDDQDPVEALATDGADPALGVRVRVRSSDRRPDDLHTLGAEDLIEGAAELAVAVVKEKTEGLPSVGEKHLQVARLLATQRPSGLLVLATYSTRRRSSETKKRT